LDVNAVRSGQTALISAIDSGDQEIAEMLIALDRIDLNIVTHADRSALSVAVLHPDNQIAIVHRILESPRFDPSVHHCSALLVLAFLNGRNEIASLLLKVPTVNVNHHVVSGNAAHAVTSKIRQEFSTPIRTAIVRGNLAIFRQIISHPTFDPSLERTAPALRSACYSRDASFLSALLDATHQNVNLKLNRWSLLCIAAEFPRSESMGLFIEEQSVIDFILKHPAFDPVESDAADAVFLLLTHKRRALAGRIPIPDVNGRLTSGRTLLTESLSPPRYEICEYILSLPGVDVNLRDGNGVTPLCACLQENVTEADSGTVNQRMHWRASEKTA
jgi:ankyrin repeat protein